MTQRASAAIIDGRIMLTANAERRGARIVHARQPRLHRLMWLREVRRTGYCCDCIGIACEAFDAMMRQER